VEAPGHATNGEARDAVAGGRQAAGQP
jgi:hypothetical protein